MKSVLDVIGWVLTLKGVGGLVREFFGFNAMSLLQMERLVPVLQDNAVAFNIACALLGVVVLLAIKRAKGSPAA
ncbi:hypothetical protein D5S17_11105 [Pseudonocardiaceae bacterium YIM PH 21723]|nr:hypothetical protein D5S17_11105 [Pseudonocardiaceae bacterium YIM PH 21723]